MECTDCLSYQLNQSMLREEFPWGNDHCNLHTMLDRLLIVIGNDFSIVPLHVLMIEAKSTPELGKLGFENEVQDIQECQTRLVKINSPV